MLEDDETVLSWNCVAILVFCTWRFQFRKLYFGSTSLDTLNWLQQFMRKYLQLSNVC